MMNVNEENRLEDKTLGKDDSSPCRIRNFEKCLMT